MTDYYFALASQKFLKEEEPLEEILRERINFYKSNKKKIDFWFVDDPEFLSDLDVEINTEQPMAAIVSTNKTFINWIKLRIGYVLIGELNDYSFTTNNLLENIIE
uniref:hypothetical protein n=1 Tax=Madagascaria erythrocladioides TaxID=753684 RepID=UPI001BEDD97B|nr:hypothetical protein MW574_pgp177 [Madagascaria erythrocladioides]QUE28941.1 Ycf54 [Madagascaria erythrocladioides]UNJ16490.1 hypothetical protein [Madagascaria erythrocladioides]